MYFKYIVKNNESLNDIANNYHLDREIIRDVNNMYYDDMYYNGKEIVLPSSNDYFDIYVVKEGDTLYGISKRYNMSLDLLASLNGIKNVDYIYKDQKILIPKNNYLYYMTVEGDTIDSVSKEFNINKEKLLKENPVIYLMPEQILVTKRIGNLK